MTSDSERLELLRAAMFRMRFVTLLAGALLTLYVVLSLAMTGFQLWAMFPMVTGGTLGAQLSYLVIGPLLGLITTALDALGAGLLVGSGVRGLQARVDPELLVPSARLLRYFWWVVVLRVVGMFAGTLFQMLVPLVLL